MCLLRGTDWICLIQTYLGPHAAQYKVAASVYTISDSAAAARSVILEADMHNSGRWLKEHPIRLKMRSLAPWVILTPSTSLACFSHKLASCSELSALQLTSTISL